jgi:hypothetical protein
MQHTQPRAVETERFDWLAEVRTCHQCGDTLMPSPLPLPRLHRAATWRMSAREAAKVQHADLWRVALMCHTCAQAATVAANRHGRKPYGDDHPMDWASRHVGCLPRKSQARLTLVGIASACERDSGVTWRSQPRLAERWDIPWSTWKRHTADLALRGLIGKQDRHRVDGTYTTDLLSLVGYPGLTMVSSGNGHQGSQLWAVPGLTAMSPHEFPLGFPLDDGVSLRSTSVGAGARISEDGEGERGVDASAVMSRRPWDDDIEF